MIDYDKLRDEYVKCFTDKSRIYMIQNYLKTYDATQKKEVPFQLFPRQQDLCRLFGDANNVVTTKPRQAGITTTAGAFIACEMCLADPDSPQTVLVIGNTLDLAQQMVTKIRDFLLQLPAWMWGDEYIKDISKINEPPEQGDIFKICNQKELILHNGCRVVARSSGPHASRGVGGVTWLIFDEAAFIENGQTVYTSAVPTVSSGGHIIMISTPNGKDLLYYETCRQAKLKGVFDSKGHTDWNHFELIELKWHQDPRYNKHLEWTRKNANNDTEIIKDEVIDEVGNVRFDMERWEQLEADGWKPRSPWYIKMCQQFNNDEMKIAQELDVSFLGSASNVVAPEFIEMQKTLNTREPLPKGADGDMFNLEETWVWKPPIPNHRYLMSIDCSRGDAADRTAIEILDMDGVDDDGKPCLEQVLEYHGKRTGDDIGEIAYWYGMLYGEAFTTIDCIGGTGDACILTMIRLGYKNLYYDDPQLKTYTMQREASSLSLTPEGKLPGFHSNSVRFQMLTFFANMVKTNQIKIRSKRVISELDTWIYKGDAARIDHQDGCHDDTLTCLAMAVFVMQYHLKDLTAAKERDAAFLRAWVNSAAAVQNNAYNAQRKANTSISAAPKPKYNQIYSSNQVYRSNNPLVDSYRWILK